MGLAPSSHPRGASPAIWLAVGTEWFAVVLSRRGSQVELGIAAAHAASLGNVVPGASAPPLGALGGVGVLVGVVGAGDGWELAAWSEWWS